jgi:hypothetical protein
MHVSYCQLGHTDEARLALEAMKEQETSDLEIRLNAEFCESTFLIYEGKHKEGLAAFAAMLERNRETLLEPEYRYPI